MDTDNNLLAEYARRGSEEAFRELVQTRINMVYSAALREARGDVSLAEDITQAVFTELARSASRLVSHPAISGWLYTCVRRMTANVRRAEQRRHRREQEVFNMNELLKPDPSNQLWQQVRPVLDDVMHELDVEDRTAVVLRFFEGRSFKEVGSALGLTENAARMRIERTLDKLNKLLSQRGVHSTASTLAAVLLAGAVLCAPPALASTVATGALASAAAVGSATFTLTKVLAMAQTKTAAAVALAVLTAAILFLRHGRPAIAPSPTAPSTPVATFSDSSDSEKNESVVPAATSRNASSALRMALQLLEAETGSPVAGAKLHLFYLLADGRGKTVNAVTDWKGQLGVEMPQAPYRALNMFVAAAGHVPKVTSWGFRIPMPSEYTMMLERGRTIGGTVVNAAGQPVVGAKIQFDDPGNDSRLAENIQFGPDTPSHTDDQGHWSCDMIPKEFERVTFKVMHGDFVETNVTVAADSADATNLIVTLSAGFAVAGLVEDASGNPITGATVRQVRFNGENERSGTTDASGAFEFKGIGAGEMSLAVQATGYAPAARTLQITGDSGAVEFQLGPGQLLRGRVTDEEGNAISNAFVETTRRAVDKIKWSTNSDADGRFNWDSAPEEPLLYSVLAEGFKRAYAVSLAADGSEHNIKLAREKAEDTFQVEGSVVDAETGVPLDAFKVFLSETEPDWAFPLEFYAAGRDGKFTLSLQTKSAHPGYQIHIEKEGYLPVASAKLLRKDGSQQLEFKLQKGSGPSGVVLSLDGEPAVNATVLLCTPLAGVTIDGPAHVEKGLNTTTCRTQTDGEGKFALTPAVDPQGVIVVHEQGYGDATMDEIASSHTVVLRPWGRIEGRLKLDSKAAPNERVVASQHLVRYTDAGRQFGYLTFRCETTTDAEGAFHFDKVPAGRCRLALERNLSDTILLSHETMVDVTAGQATQALLGGTGRPVIGKAIFPEATGSIDWRKVPARLRSKTSEPGSRPRREDFPTVQSYIDASERFTEAAAAQRYFSALCEADGSFRITDVPAGTYELKLELHALKSDSVVPHEPWEPMPIIASLVREVIVPEDQSTEPLDVGAVQLGPNHENASAR